MHPNRFAELYARESFTTRSDFRAQSEYVVGQKEKAENAKVQLTTALDLLSRTKIAEYEPPLNTIYVKSSDSLETAFKVLAKNRILSVPVYDTRSRRYNKFVDMLDFVAYIGSTYTRGQPFKELVEAEFPKIPVSIIADASQRNLWYPVQHNGSLRDALERMVKYNIHRIPIFDCDQVTHILTQTDMITFIHEHINLFSNIKDKTIDELQLAYKTVVSVPATETAINAFLLMHSKRVSGVAVVNESGKLVGNLSASDLRKLIEPNDTVNWDKLLQSVGDFLNLEENLLQTQAGCVAPSAPFEQVVSKLVSTKFHRVYVIDPLSERPIGVISQVDALDVVLSSL